MTCKDCLHLHVCKNLLETLQIVMDEKETEREKHCKVFTRREKVDKQTPKKLIIKRTHYACFDEFFCPCCQQRIISRLDENWIAGKLQNFCDECGQALDWNDYE